MAVTGKLGCNHKFADFKRLCVRLNALLIPVAGTQKEASFPRTQKY